MRAWLRRPWVRALLALLAALLVLVAVGGVWGLLERRPGDPRSDRPDGTSALAALVGDQGVDVRVASSVPSAGRGPDAPWTLVVGLPDDLRPEQWDRLLADGPTDVVLLSPGAPTTEHLGLPVQVAAATSPVAQPGCTDPSAERAGSTASAAASRAYTGSGLACYALGPGSGYLQLPHRGTTVHLLGTGWANGELLEEGNASFAMQVLGRHAELVWLTAPEPEPEDTGPTGPEAPSLLPPWWLLACLQVLVAFAALLVWRGRRLGPIVTEGLPVVVPAGEAVEGHGRLYHRIGAREHAAEVLRGATLSRLGRRLGPSDPLALVEVVGTQTGLQTEWLRSVLTGPAPTDDAGLARLATQLHEIEERVRTS
ncbi:DUF4350 domain-containing protein [Auraticoccus monumenti]|uniref:DUF4350 domain-containing protein n=1 Tax=Auraticoccus monumenti TaxID=675864 RepID=A0A1G7E3Q4_9ACTN|nr:DUF4350 domain-containing protein [Auraticoccus monumenti]SDE58140.1 hypothetical protein SAMN04489747_3807 [Auraticoccus monumenti]